MTAAQFPYHLFNSLQRAALWALLGLNLAATTTAAEIRFSTQTAPLLQKYCIGCHNRVTREGEIGRAHV